MPTSTATYAVADNDDIVVDALVGEGQPGGSTIMLGTDQLGSGGDSMTDVPVGKGSALRGKKLIVVSVTENDNPLTDNTSQTVSVKGGSTPKQIQQFQQASAKHEKISFVAVVTFV